MATWLRGSTSSKLLTPKIEAAFVKTGFKLALDGSDDRKMEIQGWSDPSPYGFR
jgi:hypothetical protein